MFVQQFESKNCLAGQLDQEKWGGWGANGGVAVRSVQHNNFSIYGAHSIWRPLNNGIHSPHTFCYFPYFHSCFSLARFSFSSFCWSFCDALGFRLLCKKTFCSATVISFLSHFFFFFVFSVFFWQTKGARPLAAIEASSPSCKLTKRPPAPLTVAVKCRKKRFTLLRSTVHGLRAEKCCSFEE